MQITWELCDHDVEFFRRELDDFVSAKVYDIHAHLWRESDWQEQPPSYVKVAPPEITMEVYKAHIEWVLPALPTLTPLSRKL